MAEIQHSTRGPSSYIWSPGLALGLLVTAQSMVD